MSRQDLKQMEDTTKDLMGFKSQVSLAQAQECILEKSILDARKPLIISKVFIL